MRRGYAIIEIRKIWVANRREYKDLIVNKEKIKNIKNKIRSFGLSFFRDQKREEQKKRKREKKRRRRGRRKRRAKDMDFYGFLWIILDTMEKKNQTINPFLMNLDLKEPYLVY